VVRSAASCFRPFCHCRSSSTEGRDRISEACHEIGTPRLFSGNKLARSGTLTRSGFLAGGSVWCFAVGCSRLRLFWRPPVGASAGMANSDCRWPGENPRQAASPSHLSADAEFAEELAIRYADTHHGLRTANYVSGKVYDSKRDLCMNALFCQIAVQHGVPVEQVSSALGRNRARILV
jgi:hypothetical protein